MTRNLGLRRWGIPTFALLAVAMSAGAPPAGAAGSHAQINGSGSSWAAGAVDTWVADVTTQGLQVVFNSQGSAQGRQDFANSTTDYGVSDIGYQGKDPVTGAIDTSSRPYAYIPIVAGGTAFPYHIEVGGQLVRNLRLSGQTIAKIFADQITNWSDPAITADNNGHALPSLPIVPIVHSEGSGSTAQFTTYLAKTFPSIWQGFAGYSTFTEYWPSNKGRQVAQNGSDVVFNYLASSSGNGAIGYDEYSYALGKNYPVAKMLNSAGYYTLPSEYNVAVALTQAIINEDPNSQNYLLQDLRNVYGYGDPRTYPLSSYSYGIIPVGSNAIDPKMTTAKRQTLADFLYHSICQGQGEVGAIGYSALPINLVQAGFNQIAKLNTADPGVDLTQESVASCANPTFVAGHPEENHLAQIAEQPAACDRQGQGPCAVAGAAATTKSLAGKGKTGSGTNGGGSGGTGNAAGGAGAQQASAVDPVTGAAVGADDGSGVTGQQSAALVANPVNVGAGQGTTATLAILAGVLLVVGLVAPPLLSRRFSARSQGP